MHGLNTSLSESDKNAALFFYKGKKAKDKRFIVLGNCGCIL